MAAQAKIKVNGTIGSNIDLPINTLVTLTNDNLGSETTYVWEILDQPPGTTDSLTNPLTATATFTPKKEGSYLIKLTVNSSLVDIQVCSVRQLKTRDRVAAAGEKTQADAADGWAIPVQETQRRVDNMYGAEFGVLVGSAGEAGLLPGNVLRISGLSTIKSGLPGEEQVPTWTKALATTSDQMNEMLGVLVAGVDGSGTPGSGALIRVRVFGVLKGLTGSPSVGATAYVSDTGTVSATGVGTIGRPIGHVVAVGGGLYDVWISGVLNFVDMVTSPITGFRLKAGGDTALLVESSTAAVRVLLGAANSVGGYVGTFNDVDFILRRNNVAHTSLQKSGTTHEIQLDSPNATAVATMGAVDGTSVYYGSASDHHVTVFRGGVTHVVLDKTSATTNRIRVQSPDGGGLVSAFLMAFHDGVSTGSAIVGGTGNFSLYFRSNDTNWWLLTAVGDFMPDSNNLRDLGASTNKVKTGYFGTSVVIGANTLTDAGSGFVQATGGFIVNNSALGFRSTDGAMKFTVASSELFLDGPTGGVNVRANEVVKFKVNSTGIAFFAATPVAQQASGENLTNNVTAGGVDGTVANFTDLTTYANDAATIRNDIYQLSRKLKQVNDALRLYGLLT